VSVDVTRILAPNPGPMTLEGTNTYRLTGGGGVVVVDPGPHDEDHLARVAAGGVDLILLTHGHPDHADGAPRLSDLTGAPVRSRFREGETVRVGQVALVVLPTPGHSSDSVCFLLEERRELLTGDTVLGRGTTVVAHPDGRLADYLASLERIAALSLDAILPGHGPAVADPAAWVAYYRAHRQERLAQVRAALAQGAGTPEEIVDSVYADTLPQVRAAALMSVRAQLDYLRAGGEPR
jgi:glyoxylase-like metal-dependent hydrolase (beta-lactamase superfamily II)